MREIIIEGRITKFFNHADLEAPCHFHSITVYTKDLKITRGKFQAVY